MAITDSDAEEISYVLEGIAADPRVQYMNTVKQHRTTTTYDHVVNVVVVAYLLNKHLRLHQDIKDLLVGAMLHDYFLYDWRNNNIGMTGFNHGFQHPQIAMNNAVRDFNVDDKVQNIISQHMWPYTITKIPRCREAWIVTAADKICAVKELCGARCYKFKSSQRSLRIQLNKNDINKNIRLRYLEALIEDQKSKHIQKDIINKDFIRYLTCIEAA